MAFSNSPWTYYGPVFSKRKKKIEEQEISTRYSKTGPYSQKGLFRGVLIRYNNNPVNVVRFIVSIYTIKSDRRGGVNAVNATVKGGRDV